MWSLLVAAIVAVVACGQNIGYKRVPGSRYGAPHGGRGNLGYGRVPSSRYGYRPAVPGTSYGAPTSHGRGVVPGPVHHVSTIPVHSTGHLTHGLHGTTLPFGGIRGQGAHIGAPRVPGIGTSPFGTPGIPLGTGIPFGTGIPLGIPGGGSIATPGLPHLGTPLGSIRGTGISSVSSPSIHGLGGVDAAQRYYLSWQQAPGTYTWDEADHHCRSLGYRLVSLQHAQKNSYVASLLTRDRIDYIWTSGTRHATGGFVWGDGTPLHGYTNWSRSGGGQGGQPDNREGFEDCLALMNNFYHDGVVWHDIACHHRKHFVCEIY